MIRIICVRTGNKFSQWYEDNLKHMIDVYSNVKYDEFVVIRDSVYDHQVFNKLLMFDRYRDGTNLYFDLDVLIKGDCNQFLNYDKRIKVCKAWWREAFHTPLNSSIISWTGDKSTIFNFFSKNSTEFLKRYTRGMDQFLYEVYKPDTFNNGYCSFKTERYETDYSVYLFNQNHTIMQSSGWWQEYFLPSDKQ